MPTRRHYLERYKPYYKHSKKIFAFDMVLLAIILLLMVFNGYYFFFRRAPSQKVTITINLEPVSVKSGQEVTFIIDYINQEEVVLKDATLSFQLPPHFYARQFFPPVNQETTTYYLGDLNPGDKGELKISGRILGGDGEKQKIFAILNYQVAGWYQAGSKNAYLEYPINGSLLNFKLSLPEEIKTGEIFDFILDYNNDSYGEFDNITIRPDWPQSFHLIKSEPALINNQWLIPGLGQGSQDKIAIEGLVDVLTPGQMICFTSYINLDGLPLKQNQVCQDPSIKPAKISFHQVVNGEASHIAQLGDELEYVIGYQNDSRENIKNVNFSLILNNDIFDLSSLESNEAKIDNNILTWPTIGILGPGQNGELKFKVRLKNAVSDEIKDLAAMVRPKADYYVLNQPESLTAPDLITKINSSLTLKVAARYYSVEGEQLGVGPLPPIANETTKYWILIQPITANNVIKDITVSGVLPINVSWGGQVISSMGRAMEYNPQTRTVVWHIGQLEPLSSKEQKLLGGGFEVRLTPTQSQVGEVATLLKNITITAKDGFTNKTISSSLPDITTDLKDDQKAAGKGIVLPN